MPEDTATRERELGPAVSGVGKGGTGSWDSGAEKDTREVGMSGEGLCRETSPTELSFVDEREGRSLTDDVERFLRNCESYV